MLSSQCQRCIWKSVCGTLHLLTGSEGYFWISIELRMKLILKNIWANQSQSDWEIHLHFHLRREYQFPLHKTELTSVCPQDLVLIGPQNVFLRWDILFGLNESQSWKEICKEFFGRDVQQCTLNPVKVQIQLTRKNALLEAKS